MLKVFGMIISNKWWCVFIQTAQQCIIFPYHNNVSNFAKLLKSIRLHKSLAFRNKWINEKITLLQIFKMNEHQCSTITKEKTASCVNSPNSLCLRSISSHTSHVSGSQRSQWKGKPESCPSPCMSKLAVLHLPLSAFSTWYDNNWSEDGVEM